MSELGRKAAVLGGALTLLLLPGGLAPAHASDTLRQCRNQGFGPTGEPPTCTKVNGTWVPSWSIDPGSSGAGMGDVIGFLFVVSILIAIGVTIWKVYAAQKLARESGLDPGMATQMTLLSDDGLDATYLAASLRRPPVPTLGAAASDGPRPTAAERLTELESLLARGLVTRAEYDERRKAIIGTV